MTSRRCSGSLYHAFSEYGISRDIAGKSIEDDFPRIVRGKLSAYIYHELGEASQRRILGRWRRQLLVNIPYSRADFFIRALKDILSDTCRSGMLLYIVNNKKTGSLSFYLSLLSGYRKSIFTNMAPAYAGFMETGDWGPIGKARDEWYKKAGNHVRKLKEMFDKGRVSEEMIEHEFISV